MSTGKTPLFRSLQKALRLAMLQEQPGMPPIDEITEWVAQERIAYTRRQFLRNSAYGGLALGAATLLPKSLLNLSQDVRIAIVGAGMAGLHAGYILKNSGLGKNITLYEGSSRTGGRMFTQKLNGNTGTTELGGEFVDSDHTDILNLAKKFNVDILDRRSDSLPTSDTFFLEGQNHSFQQAVTAFSKVRRKIGRDARSVGKNYDKPGATRLDNMTMKAYFESLQTDTWFKKLLETAYVGEFGLETDQQAALNFVDMVGRQKKGFEIFGESDERYKLKGGNQQLCDALAKDLEGKIQMGHQLQAVKSKGAGFVLSFETAGGIKEEPFDHVIMTIPFTVLREVEGIDKITGMTKEKIDCIRELGYGQNGKYFLEFKERVWRAQNQQGYLFTEEIHSGWDSFHLQNNNQGKSIYTVFLGGDAAAKIAKGGGEKYVPMIDKAYLGAKGLFTGYSEKMNWHESKWTKGSYACYKPGQWAKISGHENTPVGNMLFAGEHCSSDFQGYMNGAAETGRTAAEKLLETLKMHVAPKK